MIIHAQFCTDSLFCLKVALFVEQAVQHVKKMVRGEERGNCADTDRIWLRHTDSSDSKGDECPLFICRLVRPIGYSFCTMFREAYGVMNRVSKYGVGRVGDFKTTPYKVQKPEGLGILRYKYRRVKY